MDRSNKGAASPDSGKRPPKRRHRKCRHSDTPRRPLSAYNLFFKEERVHWLEESKAATAQVPAFEDMGREMGRRWKEKNSAEREKYVQLAREDKTRYQNEVKEYREALERSVKEKVKSELGAQSPQEGGEFVTSPGIQEIAASGSISLANRATPPAAAGRIDSENRCDVALSDQSVQNVNGTPDRAVYHQGEEASLVTPRQEQRPQQSPLDTPQRPLNNDSLMLAMLNERTPNPARSFGHEVACSAAARLTDTEVEPQNGDLLRAVLIDRILLRMQSGQGMAGLVAPAQRTQETAVTQQIAALMAILEAGDEAQQIAFLQALLNERSSARAPLPVGRAGGFLSHPSTQFTETNTAFGHHATASVAAGSQSQLPVQLQAFPPVLSFGTTVLGTRRQQHFSHAPFFTNQAEQATFHGSPSSASLMYNTLLDMQFGGLSEIAARRAPFKSGNAPVAGSQYRQQQEEPREAANLPQAIPPTLDLLAASVVSLLSSTESSPPRSSPPSITDPFLRHAQQSQQRSTDSRGAAGTGEHENGDDDDDNGDRKPAARRR